MKKFPFDEPKSTKMSAVELGTATEVSTVPEQREYMPLPLWTPKDPENTPMSKYRQRVNKKFGMYLKTSQDLHWWSITRKHDFWIDLWDVSIEPV